MSGLIKFCIYIDGSRAVCRIGLSYSTNLSKLVRLFDEVIVVLFSRLLSIVTKHTLHKFHIR